MNIQISKIGLCSDLSWPKLDLEPKCHDPETFGGFGKCEQSFILTLDHMGTPLENQNFEKQFSAC